MRIAFPVPDHASTTYAEDLFINENLMELLASCLRKSFDPSGRASRAEYWGYTFALWGVALIMVLVMSVNVQSFALYVIFLCFGAASLFPSMMVSIRRLHDIGRSGWWMLAAFFPVIGGLLLLFWSLLDSEQGANQYGPNPKAPQPLRSDAEGAA